MKITKKNLLLVESLTDPDEALSHLNVSLKFNKDEFLFALLNVAIAQGGLAKLSENTGLGKEGLYKSLAPCNNPRFDTILRIIRGLGFDIQVVVLKEIFKSNKRFIRPNSLAHLYPEFAFQWHPAKNNLLTPNDIMPGSQKKVWWRCEKDTTHEWQASCNSRVDSNYRNCPICSDLKKQQEKTGEQQ